MTASERLQAMLDEGMRLIPELLSEDPDRAPDLEAYLRNVGSAASTQAAIMKLRQAELEAGTNTDRPESVEAAIAVILQTSISTRREIIQRLFKSIPAKGMRGAAGPGMPEGAKP